MKKEISDGCFVTYVKSFIATNESKNIFNHLLNTVPFVQHYYSFPSGQYPVPRMTAWYADNPEMEYKYSGLKEKVNKWSPELLELKTKIESYTNCKFNSVLLNLYKTGKNSVSWHADNERGLGSVPTIASISLGSNRLFFLKHNKTNEKISYELENGSLLLMSGKIQQDWQHSIPKTTDLVDARINLTFRNFINKENK